MTMKKQNKKMDARKKNGKSEKKQKDIKINREREK